LPASTKIAGPNLSIEGTGAPVPNNVTLIEEDWASTLMVTKRIIIIRYTVRVKALFLIEVFKNLTSNRHLLLTNNLSHRSVNYR
jgi:hypothetical protein